MGDHVGILGVVLLLIDLRKRQSFVRCVPRYSSIVVITVDGKVFTLEIQYHLIVCFIFIVHIQIDN